MGVRPAGRPAGGPEAVELALWAGEEAAPRWAEVLTDPRLLDAGVVYAKALLYTAA